MERAGVRRRCDQGVVCPPRHVDELVDPGSPWQNPYIERFNSRARDELFAREVFDTVVEAKVVYGEWRADERRTVHCVA